MSGNSFSLSGSNDYVRHKRKKLCSITTSKIVPAVGPTILNGYVSPLNPTRRFQSPNKRSNA